MLYLVLPKLIPAYGQIVKNCKSKLCIISQNVKLRSVLNRPNSNLSRLDQLKTEPIKSKSNSQDKDRLLFYYENPRYYTIINAFAFVQFFFWLHLAEFSYNKGDKIKMGSTEYSPWWKKLDMENKNTRKMVATFCFLIGYGILSVSWIYTLRSVRMLVLRKDNKTVSIVSYGPFGRDRVLDVPLENMSTNVSRHTAKTQLPIKVKGKWFYYILDIKEGTVHNPELFDHTAGMKRVFKCIFNCGMLPQVTSSMNFNNTIKDEKEISTNFLLAVTLLQQFSWLCIISENQHFLNLFVEYYRDKNKMFTLFEFESTFVYSCQSVVMLDATPRLSERITHKKCKGAFFLFHYHTTFDLTKLRNYFENSSSPEVVVMSLQDSSLFKLSPIFPFPRSFTRTSVQGIIDGRNSTNLDDFGGVDITGAFMVYPPFTIVGEIEGRKQGVDEIDGIEILIFRELSQKLNFTLHHTIYKGWGTNSVNGTWLDGVGYAMQEGLAQVAVCGLWQLYVLDSFMDFGPSLGMEQLIFLVRRPEQVDFDWKDVIKIFKVYVWFCVFFSFALTTVVYWCGVVRVLPFYREDWSCGFLAVLGHFTMASSHSYVTDQFTLLVLTTWSIFSLLLTTVLSTGIVSSVDTLQQMVEGGYYWTGQFYAGFVSDEMKATMFDFQNPWQNLFEKKYKYMTEEDVRAVLYFDKKITLSSQVLNKDLVVLDTDGTIEHECLRKFRVAREPINKGHVSFGVEKYSPMLEPLTITTMRFMQAGLQHRWKLEVLHRWPQLNTRHLLEETDVLTFSEPEVMPFSKLRPLFYMLISGLMLALVVFCIEILWYYS